MDNNALLIQLLLDKQAEIEAYKQRIGELEAALAASQQ